MTDVARAPGEVRRLSVALATLVAWIAVTVFGAGLGAETVELEDLAARGVAWNVLAAGVLLVGVIAWRGWKDLGFRAPAPGTLKLVWLPGLLVLAMFGLAVAMGLPAPGVVLLVLFNTLLVGFSEEVMFRGVLFRALRERLRLWPSILWVTGSFGAVHVLNGFLTGSFAAAMVQAVAASCTGLLLMAVVLRGGSLWLAIVLHALWDWVAFLIVLSSGAMEELERMRASGGGRIEVEPAQLLLPLMLVLPNLLYALWLLRRAPEAPAGPRSARG